MQPSAPRVPRAPPPVASVGSGSSRGGGVVAIRGFAYQFDQTILAALDHPDEVIEVEHIEDFNGIDWCVQSKHYSGHYKPSILTKAVRMLWQIHKNEPTRRLRLHCHFTDKAADSHLAFTSANVPSTWKENALKNGNSVAPDSEIDEFLRQLEIKFTPNLETQFARLIERIESEFSLKSREDALCTHAIFRSHMLEASTKPSAEERRISLQTFHALNKAHRQLVFEYAHADYIGDIRYAKLLKSRFFKKQLNLAPAERVFVVDADAAPDAALLANFAVELSQRYCRRLRTGPVGRSPIICVRGLSPLKYQQVMVRVFDGLRSIALSEPVTRRAAIDSPLCDGYPYHSSGFRLDLLQKDNAAQTRLRVIPAHVLGEPNVLKWIASDADEIYQFRIGQSALSDLPLDALTRIFVRDIEMLNSITK